MSSFSVLLVSPGATSWLFIVFLFLDFHIAHIVIDIRIRSLSESFVWSLSNVITAAPLIRPIDMSGQGLSVDFSQMILAVSHAVFWPLFLHSSHRCGSDSVISMDSLFSQAMEWARSAMSCMLLQ